MAQTRDKNGKFSGAGGQSMENFVKMRENPGSAVTLTSKAKSLPEAISDRNSMVAWHKGAGQGGGNKENWDATLVDNDASNAKKKARADSKGSKLKASSGPQEVSRRSGMTGFKKVLK